MAELENEITAMAGVVEILRGLDPDSAQRVVRWLADRYLGIAGRPIPAAATTRPDQGAFPDLPSLFAAAAPETTTEKALVAAYWFQVCEGQADLESKTLNSELRHLGHGLSNITKALTDLIRQHPQPVIQTRKSGGSKQARKRYRLTDVGIRAVEAMVSRSPSRAQ